MVRCTRSLREIDDWGVVAIGVAGGYVGADVASGVVHWFCDRFFEEDSPFIGRLLLQPFREHHRDPLAMTRHGWLELCGNSAVAVAPLLVGAVAWPLGRAGGSLSTLTDGAVVAFALAALGTNAFHCWAHAERVPRLVARLQSLGLILAPRAHEVHHSRGGAYCVTSGWANRVIDGFSVFTRLERRLVWLGIPATRQP